MSRAFVAILASCSWSSSRAAGGIAASNRTTWNGCLCKQSWTEDTPAGPKPCATHCCNPDSDPHGDWCKVEDPTCEDEDWGYCRPLGACSDSPSEWVDAYGNDCDDYAQLLYCTSTGGYGSGWTADMGTFVDSADFEGNTARSTCCACGGGGHYAPQLVGQDTACVDFQRNKRLWEDSDGDSCQTYQELKWCTHRGYGPGWHDSWGSFGSFAVNMSIVEMIGIGVGGKNSPSFIANKAKKAAAAAPKVKVTASRACCACGGGNRISTKPEKYSWLKSHLSTLDRPLKTANALRQTWNGCACQKVWKDDEKDPWGHEAECDSYCCNKDNDPYGTWCLVADSTCEDAAWGYCRPLVAPAGTPPKEMPIWAPFRLCGDVPAWRDSDGDSCWDYARMNWCNAKGVTSQGWHSEWGALAKFASGGNTANTACCACGGGQALNSAQHTEGRHSQPGESSLVKRTALKLEIVRIWQSRPRETWNRCTCLKQWKDEATGKDCGAHCCNPDADPHGDWCMLEDATCEESGWGYCRPMLDNLDLPKQKSTCSDVPRHWADKRGNTCSDYLTKGLCNATGGYGAGWGASWGTFHDNAGVEGHTAYSTCCDCGGGARPAAFQHCVDQPLFLDSEGDGCDAYYSLGWCNASTSSLAAQVSRLRDHAANGRAPHEVYGSGWKEEWGTLHDYTNSYGDSARGACCACGGGQISRKEKKTRVEKAKAIVENSYGLVIILPVLLCACCITGLVCWTLKRAKVISLPEVPGVNSYGKSVPDL